MNPDNKNNLIPLNKRPIEERKNIASIGGIASGIARKNKTTMKDIANHFLNLPKTKGRKTDFNSIKTLESIEEINLDMKSIIVLQQIKKASEGDLKAAEWIQNLIGETPEEMIQARNDELEGTEDFLQGIQEALYNTEIQSISHEEQEEAQSIDLLEKEALKVKYTNMKGQ